MAGVLGRRAASALAGRVLHNTCLQGQAACLHQELQQRCVADCVACGMLSCCFCLLASIRDFSCWMCCTLVAA